MSYSGREITCDTSTVEGCGSLMHCQPRIKPKAEPAPKRASKEIAKDFVPINHHEKKFRMSIKMRVAEIFLNDPPFGVLDEFRMIHNQNKILEDAYVTCYQLLALVTNDEPMMCLLLSALIVSPCTKHLPALITCTCWSPLFNYLIHFEFEVQIPFVMQ